MERKIHRNSKKCLVCDFIFYTKPSHLGRRKFCSRVCFNQHRKNSLLGDKNPCWRGGRPKCNDCHKLLTHWGHYNGRVNRCSPCQIKFNSGANHYNWKGGITKENAKIRNSYAYKCWRKSVFERDNYTCVWCGHVGGNLHADHIKPFSLFKECRLDLDNGRTLCVGCHKKTDTYLSKMFKYKYICKKEI